MTYHSISKYPTVCVLMTIQMGEIISFELVSNLYRLSDSKWRLLREIHGIAIGIFLFKKKKKKKKKIRNYSNEA